MSSLPIPMNFWLNGFGCPASARFLPHTVLRASPLEARKPLRNLWGYHQTRGLGYHEYFLFCEDMGAEPVPVLAAGVPCQNSGTCAHHSKGELTCMGQQGGIPMEEMDQYIQDVLDLIEYANGDARKTVWGKKRAEAGHPKPFNLKFIDRKSVV